MAPIISILILIFLSYTLTFTYSLPSDDITNRDDNYVEEACSVTRYQDLCIRSLAPFANKAKENPIKWARLGVSVTIREAKKQSQYLTKLSHGGNVTKGRNRIALSDCVETFQDTIDNLHKSLGVLRELSVREFSSQMEDVTTWVSAALTDEDTCLDGFGGQKGKRFKSLINRISNVSRLTSNALALVNKLATTGPGSLKY